MLTSLFARNKGQSGKTDKQEFELNLREILALNMKCQTLRVKEGHAWITHDGIDAIVHSGEIIQMKNRGKAVISPANRHRVVFELAG